MKSRATRATPINIKNQQPQSNHHHYNNDNLAMSINTEKMPYGDASSHGSPVRDPESETLMNADEVHLASLGYKQEFFRSLGIFENWAATFTVCHFKLSLLT